MNRPSYLLFKKCSKCGEILHVSRYYKDKGKKYGVRNDCKKCCKEYREGRKEERREYKKKYYQENKEESIEKSKKYREKHREELLNKNKKWRENNTNYFKNYYKDNKDKILEKNKQWREDNEEYRKEYKKQWREDNKEYMEQWRKDNKEYIEKYNKKYYEENPEKFFNQSNKRRNKLENQGRGITKEQWKEMMDFFDWKCAYSGEKMESNNTTNGRTIDHIIALDNNGENEPWNCVPMRRGYNSNKHTNNMLDWYIQQEYFDIDRLTKIYEWRIYAYWKWKE